VNGYAFTITASANNEAQRLRELFQNATEPTEFTKVWVYPAAPQSVAAKSYTPTAELHWKLKQTSISQFRPRKFLMNFLDTIKAFFFNS
jgi:hypothetical protein